MIMFLIEVNVSKGTYLMFGKFDENCFIDVVQIKVTSHWPFVLPQKVFFSLHQLQNKLFERRKIKNVIFLKWKTYLGTVFASRPAFGPGGQRYFFMNERSRVQHQLVSNFFQENLLL